MGIASFWWPFVDRVPVRSSDAATCCLDAHRGRIVRQSHSLYSSKQSAQVLTGENRSLPHAEESKDVENPFSEAIKASSRCSSNEVTIGCGCSDETFNGAAYAIEGQRPSPWTKGQRNEAEYQGFFTI